MWTYTENLSTVTDLQQVAQILGNDSKWLTAVAEQNLPGQIFLKTELISSEEPLAIIKEQQEYLKQMYHASSNGFKQVWEQLKQSWIRTM